MKEEKPVGERLATLEAWAVGFEQYVRGEFGAMKGLLNPKLDKVDALWEWREGHIRDEERRDRRLSRQIAIYSILITVVITTVNILIHIKF